MRDFPEADWRILRSLAAVALDRFCKRVLEEAAPLAAGAEGQSTGYHERYLALYRLLQQRDEELGGTFNDLKRSTAPFQLAGMRHRHLLTDDEFRRFSQGTREAVEGILSLPET